MLKPVQIKQYLNNERNVMSLSTASFLMASGAGIYMVVLPFIIKRLGGTDSQAGTCLALNFASYMVACFAGGIVMDKLNAKRAIQYGSVGIALLFGGMYATIIYASQLSRPIWVIGAFGAFVGMLSALFWPPLMGLISTGHEGKELNRRLGTFNVSMSLGSCAGPYIGGILVSINSSVPMLATALVIFSSFIAVHFAHNPRHNTIITANDNNNSTSVTLNPSLNQFRWMARIALLTSSIAIGILRSQLGILFKFELGFSETDYGIAITIMFLANVLIFWIARHTHAWHYRPLLLFGMQLAIVGSMAAILIFQTLWILFIVTAIVGGAEAFLYTSHLFYGASGKKNRSALMALHEFLLSLGLASGSVIGGYLSDGFGRYMPYWFGLAVVATGLLACAQVILKKPAYCSALSKQSN